jgi:apolipoprotein D and lipocalin family protein
MRGILFSLIILIGVPAFSARTPVQAIEAIDIKAYLGKWYEIARVENEFQIGCRDTTMTYSLSDENSLSVENGCVVGDGSFERHRTAYGHAWLDSEHSAKMKVTFVHFIVWWKPFANDYWVLEVGTPDADGLYPYAIVGHPRRRYGWVLSRTKNVDDQEYKELMKKVSAHGYDSSLFKRTDQMPAQN